MKSNSTISKCCSLLLVLVLLLTPIAPVIATSETPVSLVPALMTGNTVSLAMQIDSAWEGYFNATITLANTGEKPIENWALSFSFPHTITNIWNGIIFEQADGMYTVKNAGWNQDVPIGGSVSFGFTAQQNGEALTPNFFFINTAERSVPSMDYEATYKLKKDWGTGFSGEITLKNISSQVIEDWSFSMDFARTVTNASNTIFTQGEGTQYLLNNPGYDQNINTGKSIKIGIQGTGGVETDVPSNFNVYQVTVGVSLTGDYDADGVKDYEELVLYGTDPLVSEETTPTPTPVPTLTPTPTSTPTPTPTSTPTPTPAEEIETDTDGDGIPDNYEIEIGTDPLLIDTDGDGIDDMTELICGLDPLTSDVGLDFDGDGLTLQQELELGTEFWNEDTDYDGLLDGEEVNTYGTDPLLEDTDGDGLLDGDEILLGKNPLSADSDGDGIPDSEDKVLQQMSVDMYNAESLGISSVDIEMDLAHLIDNVVNVKDEYNIDVLSTGVASRIGSPISFECEEEFESATVVFHYDEAALGETAEQNLGVLWYDEENGVYVVEEQAIVDENANTVTLELEHFSTYILVNLAIWIQDASATIDYDNTSGETGVPYTYTDEKYSYIFMVEDSAYFTESQRLSSLSIMREFVSNLRPGEQMTVGRVYDTYAYGWNSMTEDKALMNSALNYFMGPDFVPAISTGTAYSFDVTAAVRFLRSHSANYNAGNIPVMILITTNVSMVYNSEMFTIPSECGGRVFAINIADPMLLNGMFDDALRELMNGSGGIPLIGSTQQQIWNNYVNPPAQDPTIDFTDSDGDGLYDWLETGGMKCTNGSIYYSDPNTKHSDEDGVTDGEEMGPYVRIEKTTHGDLIIEIGGEIITGYFASQFQIYAPQDAGVNYVFLMRSNPKVNDTDGDGSDDHLDASTLRVNDEAIYILYNPNEYKAEAEYWERKYEKEGYYVEINACETISSFKDKWNAMGLDGWKEKYQLEKVYLLFHGDLGGFRIEYKGYKDWIGTDYFKESEKRLFDLGLISETEIQCSDSISELHNQSIDTLVLNICESGNIDFVNSDPNTYLEGSPQTTYGYNLAAGFLLSQPYINSVRAWNGYYVVQCKVVGFSEHGNKDGVNEFQSYDYYRDENGIIKYITNTNIEQTGVFAW